MVWIIPWLVAVGVWLAAYGIGVLLGLSSANNGTSATGVALMAYGAALLILTKEYIP